MKKLVDPSKFNDIPVGTILLVVDEHGETDPACPSSVWVSVGFGQVQLLDNRYPESEIEDLERLLPHTVYRVGEVPPF